MSCYRDFRCVAVCVCVFVQCLRGANAGVAIDDSAATALRGMRTCLLNTNQDSPGTKCDKSQAPI